MKERALECDGDPYSGGGAGIESWAQCDLAELPSSVTEALGIEVWEDTSGYEFH